MDMFNVSGHGNAETYLIQQRAEMNPILTSPGVEQVGAMYNEGNPSEFFVDQQGLYYPAATNYGYYCTGFETPGEWADHQNIFGVDGSEIQYVGAQTESLPYVYYTPSYGYAQSPYNPYNPYIPGAVVGVDDPYAGAQQYYTVPSYQDAVASSGYIPVVIQSDIFPNGSAVPSLDTGVALSNRPDGKILKHGHSSSSAAFHRNPPKPASNQTNLLTRIPEGPRANVGASNHSVTKGGASSGSFPTRASSYVVQNRRASGRIHAIDNISNGIVHPHHNQLKVTLPINNGFSDFGSSARGQTSVDKLRSNIHVVGRTLNDFNGNSELLDEQNRGPRINKSKNQLAVKGYTTKLGDSNALGNIIIHTEQYNKDDFVIDYADAKYFVIKSYSEDDVHKSIKYNVWSSTPHGNKKLQVAYEEAQKIAAGKPRGCPIFLFFSVNASGQFCGVAEMIGPVDFHKDMDFWQQDKWNGSFPVKWHIIKDIPNSSLRHIILVNNENKSVTNSRDTQEIMYKQGLEMLKIFKNHPLKTSLLDDFMYYENRQKIMHEGKARLTFKSSQSPLLVPALDATQKLNGLVERSPNKDEKIMKQNDPNILKKGETNKDEKVVDQNAFNDSKKTEKNKDEKIMNENDISISSWMSAAEQPTSHSCVTTNSSRIEDSSHATLDADCNTAAVLKIGSLDLNPMQAESRPLSHAANKSVDVVTVGSVPVKVNGLTESSRFLTFGTITLDPRSLQLEKGGAFAKQGSQN